MESHVNRKHVMSDLMTAPSATSMAVGSSRKKNIEFAPNINKDLKHMSPSIDSNREYSSVKEFAIGLQDVPASSSMPNYQHLFVPMAKKGNPPMDHTSMFSKTSYNQGSSKLPEEDDAPQRKNHTPFLKRSSGDALLATEDQKQKRLQRKQTRKQKSIDKKISYLKY